MASLLVNSRLRYGVDPPGPGRCSMPLLTQWPRMDSGCATLDSFQIGRRSLPIRVMPDGMCLATISCCLLPPHSSRLLLPRCRGGPLGVSRGGMDVRRRYGTGPVPCHTRYMGSVNVAYSTVA